MRRSDYPLTTDPYTAPEQPVFLSDIRGPLRHITSAGGLAVSLSEAKAHCRIETDADDVWLTGRLKAAERFVETRIDGHRQIFPATYDLPVRCWWDGVLKFPRPPLQSVTSVKYYDTAGTETTLSTDYYLTDTAGLRQPGWIMHKPDQVFPDHQADRRYPVTIRFVAGYLAPVTAAVTDTITSTGRAFNDNDQVRFWTAGGVGWALPTGLFADKDYWVRDASSQTFKVAEVPGGSAVDITGTGTGLHFCGLIPEEIKQAILLIVGHWYANREAALAGVVPQEVVLGVKEILGGLGWGGYA